MTEATAAVEDSGAPAILDTKDVVDMFKQCNLAVYAEARREFYREVSLNPFKPHPEGLLRMIEWQFWDWFSFDCSISDIGLTGDEGSDMRVELVHNKDNGISPFRAMAEYMYAVDPQVGERKLQDFRDIDDTNFASMFWLKDANAVKGIMTVEDRHTSGTASLSGLVHCGELRHANTGHHAGGADGAWADTDLDGVNTGVDHGLSALTGGYVTADDVNALERGIGLQATNHVESQLGLTVGGVDHEHVHAGFHQSGSTVVGVAQEADARGDASR